MKEEEEESKRKEEEKKKLQETAEMIMFETLKNTLSMLKAGRMV